MDLTLTTSSYPKHLPEVLVEAPSRWELGPSRRNPEGVVLVSLLMVTLLAWKAWEVRPGLNYV